MPRTGKFIYRHSNKTKSIGMKGKNRSRETDRLTDKKTRETESKRDRLTDR